MTGLRDMGCGSNPIRSRVLTLLILEVATIESEERFSCCTPGVGEATHACSLLASHVEWRVSRGLVSEGTFSKKALRSDTFPPRPPTHARASGHCDPNSSLTAIPQHVSLF